MGGGRRATAASFALEIFEPTCEFRNEDRRSLMEVTRIDDAPAYVAPGHFDMRGVRMQGWDVTSSQGFWVGLSHFLPGGGVDKDAGSLEKIYVLIEGEVTVITDSGEVTLHPLDSCYIAPGEARSIENRGSKTALMLVVAPYPDGAR
jgi:quercetin dioxygenase-like cupin family protein